MANKLFSVCDCGGGGFLRVTVSMCRGKGEGGLGNGAVVVF